MGQKTILFCGNGMSGESLYPIKEAGYKICVITEFPNDNGLEVADAVEEAVLVGGRLDAAAHDEAADGQVA